jgi:phosphoglycolate phosphatase
VSLLEPQQSESPLLQPSSCAVFDKDGTLIRIDESWAPALGAILSILTGDEPTLMARAAAELGLDVVDWTLSPDSPVVEHDSRVVAGCIARAIGAEPGDEFTARFDHLMARLTAGATPPVDGADEVLARFKASGIRLAIATNDSEKTTRAQLEALGWGDHFEIVLGYDSGYGAKPEPGMLHAIADHFGVPTTHLFMVGDTPTDIMTACAAHSVSVLIGDSHQFEPAPDIAVPSLRDLPDALGLDRIARRA